MSTARTSSRHTAADYATWSGDWELHAGEAIAMTPSPFGRHGELLARMAAVLCNAIDAAGCNATVLAEVDWIVNDQTVVRPDLAVICGAAPVGHLTPTNMRKLKRVAAALGGSANFNGFPPAKAVHVNQE